MSLPDFSCARFNGTLFMLPDDCDIYPGNFHLPTDVGEFMESISVMIKPGTGTAYDKAVTGESYTEFATGIRLRGGLLGEAAANRRLLRWMWLVMLDYRDKQAARAKLYWRCKPEFATFDRNQNFDLLERGERATDLVRRIYMRCLISSLPEQEQFFEPA